MDSKSLDVISVKDETLVLSHHRIPVESIVVKGPYEFSSFAIRIDLIRITHSTVPRRKLSKEIVSYPTNCT